MSDAPNTVMIIYILYSVDQSGYKQWKCNLKITLKTVFNVFKKHCLIKFSIVFLLFLLHLKINPPKNEIKSKKK